MDLFRCECLSGVGLAELQGVWVLGGERARAKDNVGIQRGQGKAKEEEDAGCLTRREAPGQKKVFLAMREGGEGKEEGRRREFQKGRRVFGH